MFAVPILSRICEGIVWHSGPKKSLLDKLAGMFLGGLRSCPLHAVLVADAYYASRKIILPLLEKGHHLISRVKMNAVAFAPAPKLLTRRRGRPRIYGKKIRLRNLFKIEVSFKQALHTIGSWLRTMKTDMVPSEMVVAQALRTRLPDFLLSNHDNSDLKKFILDHADYDRLPDFKMAA
jgi:hypothetical protein